MGDTVFIRLVKSFGLKWLLWIGRFRSRSAADMNLKWGRQWRHTFGLGAFFLIVAQNWIFLKNWSTKKNLRSWGIWHENEPIWMWVRVPNGPSTYFEICSFPKNLSSSFQKNPSKILWITFLLDLHDFVLSKDLPLDEECEF